VIENIWVTKFVRKKSQILFENVFFYSGSRYIELYFDSPRYASLNIQRKKPDAIPRRASRSPSKPKYNRYSRSRSIFFNKKFLFLLFTLYSR